MNNFILHIYIYIFVYLAMMVNNETARCILNPFCTASLAYNTVVCSVCCSHTYTGYTFIFVACLHIEFYIFQYARACATHLQVLISLRNLCTRLAIIANHIFIDAAALRI